MKPAGELVEYPAKTAYQRAEIARSYDQERFHGLVGRFKHRAEAELITWAIGLAGLSGGAKIADIPTGTGRFLSLLHGRGLSVTAVDVSSAMLDVARLRAQSVSESVSWVAADATSLPFLDDEFDAVLSVRLMNHLPVVTRSEVLAQFARVARRYVLVTFTDTTSIQGLLRRGARRRRNVPQFPAGVSQARQELASAGLELRATRHLLRGISETYMCVAAVVGTTCSASGS